MYIMANNQHKVTATEIQFIDLYFLYGFNATKAYLMIRSDVSDSTARAEASRLLKRPEVKELIKEKELDIRRRSAIELDYLVEALKKVVDDVKVEKTERDKNGRFISHPDRANLVKAVDTLAKLGGFYTQKMDVTTGGEKVNTITIKYKGDEEDESDE